MSSERQSKITGENLLFYLIDMTVPVMLVSIALATIYKYLKQRFTKDRIG